jgi:hypothetical protein
MISRRQGPAPLGPFACREADRISFEDSDTVETSADAHASVAKLWGA